MYLLPAVDNQMRSSLSSEAVSQCITYDMGHFGLIRLLCHSISH